MRFFPIPDEIREESSKASRFVSRFTLGMFFLFILVSSVSAVSDDGNLDWTLSTAHAPFSARYASGSAVFDGKIWIIGGNDQAGSLNDVWSSPDGVTWTQMTANAPFVPRSGLAVTVYDDKLWVIGGEDARHGGLNDVWYSPDGVTWTRATSHAAFSPRTYHTVTVYAQKMWIIGGAAKEYQNQGTWNVANDVWSSSDGVTWTEITQNHVFSPRSEHTSVVFNNKIWVIGGWNGKSFLNDIWYSADGMSWTQADAPVIFSPRCDIASAVSGGKLWAIGGQLPRSTHSNEVWYSNDGLNWERTAVNATFSPRQTTALATGDHLWVIGGFGDGSVYLNDVWYSLRSPIPEDYANTALTSGQQIPGGLLISKTVSPSSIKQGTGTRVTITLTNTGTTPVHDIEILDETRPEFPVTGGVTQYALPQILEPNETRIFSYTVQGIKAGRYVLNKTQVMYAGEDGNYQRGASNAPVVVVLEPLIAQDTQNPVSFPRIDIGKSLSDFIKIFSP
jgi:hypothetical protein